MLCLSIEHMNFKKLSSIFFVIIFSLLASWSSLMAEKLVPVNLFNIGDSIGEAEAADNVVGSHHHNKVWSTGFDGSDSIYSFNERFGDKCPARFQKNDATMDWSFNQAITGSVMSDFADQASRVTNSVKQTDAAKAGMIAVYLGNNDVCSTSLESMPSAAEFENNYRAGLDVLAGSTTTRTAVIHVSSIPAIYWLWQALYNNDWCRIAWQLVPCQNMLGNPVNDCGAGQSYLDPDTIHGDDGPNCRRRKTVHARIRDIYNPILNNVLNEYIKNGLLKNAYFNDIFDVRFRAEHINTGDCFHPSFRGQAFLAQSQWQRSEWYSSELVCSEEEMRQPVLPWLHLLLSN